MATPFPTDAEFVRLEATMLKCYRINTLGEYRRIADRLEALDKLHSLLADKLPFNSPAVQDALALTKPPQHDATPYFAPPEGTKGTDKMKVLLGGIDVSKPTPHMHNRYRSKPKEQNNGD